MDSFDKSGLTTEVLLFQNILQIANKAFVHSLAAFSEQV